jgi:hypothetical protein
MAAGIDLSGINWVEAGSIATAAAALTTMVLAIGTLLTARQTKRAASASVALSETATAELSLRQTQDRASQIVRIRISRYPKGAMKFTGSPAVFEIYFKSIGPAPATLIGAQLGDRAGKLLSDFAHQETEALVQFRNSNPVPWGPLDLNITYRGFFGGQTLQVLTGQVAADAQSRLMVTETEASEVPTPEARDHV